MTTEIGVFSVDVEILSVMEQLWYPPVRDLRIVFFRSNRIFESYQPYIPRKPQAYRTGLSYVDDLHCERTKVRYGTEYLFISIQS